MSDQMLDSYYGEDEEGCNEWLAKQKDQTNKALNGSPLDSVVTLEQIEAVLETVYDGIEAESKSAKDVYDNSLALRGMLAVLECRVAVRNLFKQQAQVEHEAKHDVPT